MANKVKVSIDANKARDLIQTRSYQNKEGNTVEIKEIVFELIEMRPESQKVLKDAEKYQMVKTHFAVKPQTKEEREAKADSVFVGDGISIQWKSEGGSQPVAASTPSSAPSDDLPF